MIVAGLTPNLATCNAALCAAKAAGRWQDAEALLDKFLGSRSTRRMAEKIRSLGGLRFTSQVQSPIPRWSESVETCGNQWKPFGSATFRMQNLGLPPDAQSYTAAIGACGAAGCWEEALQLLERAERETTLEPNCEAVTGCVWRREETTSFRGSKRIKSFQGLNH